jgi:hypothetical protein
MVDSRDDEDCLAEKPKLDSGSSAVAKGQQEIEPNIDRRNNGDVEILSELVGGADKKKVADMSKDEKDVYAHTKKLDDSSEGVEDYKEADNTNMENTKIFVKKDWDGQKFEVNLDRLLQKEQKVSDLKKIIENHTTNREEHKVGGGVKVSMQKLYLYSMELDDDEKCLKDLGIKYGSIITAKLNQKPGAGLKLFKPRTGIPVTNLKDAKEVVKLATVVYEGCNLYDHKKGDPCNFTPYLFVNVAPFYGTEENSTQPKLELKVGLTFGVDKDRIYQRDTRRGFFIEMVTFLANYEDGVRLRCHGNSNSVSECAIKSQKTSSLTVVASPKPSVQYQWGGSP